MILTNLTLYSYKCNFFDKIIYVNISLLQKLLSDLQKEKLHSTNALNYTVLHKDSCTFPLQYALPYRHCVLSPTYNHKERIGMKLSKGAYCNLINRYRAVLKKCHLLNTFGSLAVAAMLVMGGASAAQAAASLTISQDGQTVSGTFENLTNDDTASAPAVVINEGIRNTTIQSGTIFKGNTNNAATFGGAVKALGHFNIEDGVIFDSNTAGENALGGGALHIKLGNGDYTIQDMVYINAVEFNANKALNTASDSGLGGAIGIRSGGSQG